MRGINLKFSRVWFWEKYLFSGCARTIGRSKVAFSWFYEITFIRRREGLKSDMDPLWRLVRSCPDAYFRVEKLRGLLGRGVGDVQSYLDESSKFTRFRFRRASKMGSKWRDPRKAKNTLLHNSHFFSKMNFLSVEKSIHMG